MAVLCSQYEFPGHVGPDGSSLQCCRLGFWCMQACLCREYCLPWKLQDGPLSASLIFAKHCAISEPPNPFWDLKERLQAVYLQCASRGIWRGGRSGTGERHSQHEHHAVLVGEKRVRYCQLALRICCPCYNQLLSSSEYLKPFVFGRK